MKTYCLIFLGGGLGSILRYILSKPLNTLASLLPLGTLLTNICSCFVVGMVAQTLSNLPTAASYEWVRILVVVGFCGGFSTFSTFANENIALVKNSQMPTAFLYTLLSIGLCHGAVWLGARVMTSY